MALCKYQLTNYILKSIEASLIKKGEEFRAKNKISDEDCLRFENLKLSEDKITKMTSNDINILKNGDIGQGEALNNKKYVFRK